MKNNECLDKTILALRAKYRQKKLEHELVKEEIQVGVNRTALYSEALFEKKCFMMLPETMHDMKYLDVKVKYLNGNRPQIIKTDDAGDATITFSLFPISDIEENESIFNILEQIRSDMKKVWKQNVFYDVGEILANELPIVWMDFRTFCLDGSLYSIIFIFRMEEQLVLGNFHCSFPQYHIWKPVILKLLTTIQIGE